MVSLPPLAIRGAGLNDVMPSALAALGVSGWVDSLTIGPARHVVVLLIDGLGLMQLNEFEQVAPFLSAEHGGVSPRESQGLTASIPTTTPVNLASLGVGALPGAHGFVGASFWLPDFEARLSPLRWGSVPSPVAVQPESTMFETAERAGIRVTTISAGAYAASGLTRSVLRGGEYVPSEDVDSRVADVRSTDQAAGSSLTYMYWADLDKIGHVYGVGSVQWVAGLRTVNQLAERVWMALGPGAVLIVTADHGMVNTNPRSFPVIDEDRELMTDVTRIAGEPRARLIYTRAGSVDHVAACWRHVLGKRAEVLTRNQVVDTGLIGPVDPAYEGRLGDLLVLAHGDFALASRSDTRVSGLIGQHGSHTDAETRVPGLVVRR